MMVQSNHIFLSYFFFKQCSKQQINFEVWYKPDMQSEDQEVIMSGFVSLVKGPRMFCVTLLLCLASLLQVYIF